MGLSGVGWSRASDPRRGTQFPVMSSGATQGESTPSRPAPSRSTPAPDDPAARFRVLLVEDSKAVAEIFAMMLRELGHEVRIVATGDQALAQLPELHPQIVFSDISMPGMSGYDLARHIRQHPDASEVYLVAMTGYGQPEDRQRSLEAGFDEHLVKPADLDRLRSVFAAAAAR